MIPKGIKKVPAHNGCVGCTFKGEHQVCKRPFEDSCREPESIYLKEFTDAGDPKLMADNHWKYLEQVLFHAGNIEAETEITGFHYRTAFVHGYKHGAEDARNGL